MGRRKLGMKVRVLGKYWRLAKYTVGNSHVVLGRWSLNMASHG